MFKNKPTTTIIPDTTIKFDPQLDAEHYYINIFFELHKQAILAELDGMLRSIFKHGLNNTIIETLYQNEINYLRLQRPTFRALLEVLDFIYILTLQFRRFALAIEEHTAGSKKALPKNVTKLIQNYGGLLVLINAKQNNLSDENIKGLLHDIKNAEINRDEPITYNGSKPVTLSELFTAIAVKTKNITPGNLRQFITIALATESAVKPVLASEFAVLTQALTTIYRHPHLTGEDFLNASTNALYLYSLILIKNEFCKQNPKASDLLKKEGLAATLTQSDFACVIAYLLQFHRYREIPFNFTMDDNYGKLHFLSRVAELDFMRELQPSAQAPDLTQTLLLAEFIQLFKEYDTPLAKEIIAALQGYAKDSHPDLIAYIRRILLNVDQAAIKNEQPSPDNWEWLIAPMEDITLVTKNATSPFHGALLTAWELLTHLQQLYRQQEAIIAEEKVIEATIKSKEQVLENPNTATEIKNEASQYLYRSYKNPYKSSRRLMLSYLELAEFLKLKDMDIKGITLDKLSKDQAVVTRINRAFGYRPPYFHGAHLPFSIHKYLFSSRYSYKEAYLSILTQAYIAKMKKPNSNICEFVEYVNKLNNSCPSRFVELDKWLRGLLRLIEEQLITINGELKPDLAKVLPVLSALYSTPEDRQFLLHHLISAYTERVGHCISHYIGIGLCSPEELSLYPYLHTCFNRINHLQIKFPALSELAMILTWLLEMVKCPEKIAALQKKLTLALRSNTCETPLTVAEYFASASELINTLPAEQPSNDANKFLAKIKPDLLLWLQDNIAEMLQPARHKRYLRYLDRFTAAYNDFIKQNKAVLGAGKATLFKAEPSRQPASETVATTSSRPPGLAKGRNQDE